MCWQKRRVCMHFSRRVCGSFVLDSLLASISFFCFDGCRCLSVARGTPFLSWPCLALALSALLRICFCALALPAACRRGLRRAFSLFFLRLVFFLVVNDGKKSEPTWVLQDPPPKKSRKVQRKGKARRRPPRDRNSPRPASAPKEKERRTIFFFLFSSRESASVFTLRRNFSPVLSASLYGFQRHPCTDTPLSSKTPRPHRPAGCHRRWGSTCRRSYRRSIRISCGNTMPRTMMPTRASPLRRPRGLPTTRRPRCLRSHGPTRRRPALSFLVPIGHLAVDLIA
nr:hypothetical protein [Pandoravirus massiliensis]